MKCSGFRRAVSGPICICSISMSSELMAAMACFPTLRLGECRLDFLGLKGELVVEELVEKNLGDDLEFVAIVAQTVGGANGLEAVDQLAGALFKLLVTKGVLLCYRLPPVRAPAENSFMYSATTSWLMLRLASGVSLMFWRVMNSPMTMGCIIRSK
jgi:hypothetical protein